jgi:hypothetical protein
MARTGAACLQPNNLYPSYLNTNCDAGCHAGDAWGALQVPMTTVSHAAIAQFHARK